MNKINVKPLSVNEAWQGRRYKTKKYKKYIDDLTLLLPKLKIDNKRMLFIELEFGFSNLSSDIDNPVKMILDIMQKKYNFNDSNVYKLNLSKKKVKKGEDYFSFKIDYI